MDGNSESVGSKNFSFDGEDGSDAIDPRNVDGSSNGDSGEYGTGGNEQFDPAIHVSPDKRNKDGSYTRKRGRRKGQSGSQNQSKKKDDLKGSIEQLANVIMIAHAGVAMASKCPEIELDKDESELLAKSTANVLEQYDIKPDPKTEAIIGLIVALATVYAPRVVAINMRVKAERKARKEESATVYNADGSFAGETTYNETNSAPEPTEPVDNAGTI